MITTTPATEQEPATTELALDITGMTCASCVRRVEKALAKVEGVQEARVNLATEQARVIVDPARADRAALTAAVERAGYGVATMPAAPATAAPTAAPLTDPRDAERARHLADLRRKALVSLAIGLVMMALMYLPLALPMDLLAPILLIAATVVQVWAGQEIYRPAWAAARHGATNMNTLVALGTSVAFGYSAVVTLWPS
ncbi:MAG: cation-translocating P-type ATPase, partial [Chloroflexi bacterium]|nr:cation-translocating P-type ATPase [Chloroflexota bacterium]